MSAKEANDLLRQVWADLQKSHQEHELKIVQAAPDKHRLTRLMSRGAHTGYTYFPAGKKRLSKRREERYRWCVATHRNAANVFLIWKQIDRLKLVKGHWTWFEAQRYEFQWSPSKKEAQAIAKRKADKFKADLQHEAVAKLPHASPEVYAMVARAIG